MAELNGNGTAVKAMEAARSVARTVQQPPPGQGPFYQDSNVIFIASQADEFVPWGTNTKARDGQLRNFIATEPLFASALGSVVSRNSAFSWTIEGPEKEIDRWQKILQTANFGKGWANLISQVSIDLYTQDNGAFIEIIREADSESSRVVGLAHLDAARCYHTGIPETPVLYQDRAGKYHLLKWYQVICLAEMPATFEGFPGLQYCALSRMLRAARILRDVGIYIAEKVGGRHTRAVTFLKGVNAEQVIESAQKAQLQNDSNGMYRFSMPVLVSSVSPEADVGFQTLEITSIPDGFDLDLSFKQYIAQIALAFLSDYQEFAPLPGGNLGTSSQSEILHLKTRGKGPAIFMKMVEHAINWFVLPDNIEFRFDEQDAEGDKTQAEIKSIRATTRKTQLDSGEILPEVAAMMALEDGDLTQEQYDALEKLREDAKKQEADQKQQQAEALAKLPSPEDQLNDGARPPAQGKQPGEQNVTDAEQAAPDAQKAFVEKFSPAQPRAHDGKWTSGGGGFPSYDTAEGFSGSANVDEWNASLTPGEMASIRAYTSGPGYHGISGGLRNGKVPAKHQTSVDNLDSVVSKGKIEKDVTLYRGAYFDTRGVKPGEVYMDDSFISTSFSKDSANAFVPKGKLAKHGVMFEMRTPAGTNAGFLFKEPPKKTKFPDENEIILPRGTRFRITEVIPKQGKIPKTLVVDILPPRVKKTLETGKVAMDDGLPEDAVGMFDRWDADGDCFVPAEESASKAEDPTGRDAVEQSLADIIEESFDEAYRRLVGAVDDISSPVTA